MITQYFITLVIPLVFSSFIAAFGWFAYEEMGAVVSGVLTFLITATWSNFAVISAQSHRRVKSLKNTRRATAHLKFAQKKCA
jgi:hypothetical protein